MSNTIEKKGLTALRKPQLDSIAKVVNTWLNAEVNSKSEEGKNAFADDMKVINRASVACDNFIKNAYKPRKSLQTEVIDKEGDVCKVCAGALRDMLKFCTKLRDAEKAKTAKMLYEEVKTLGISTKTRPSDLVSKSEQLAGKLEHEYADAVKSLSLEIFANDFVNASKAQSEAYDKRRAEAIEKKGVKYSVLKNELVEALDDLFVIANADILRHDDSKYLSLAKNFNQRADEIDKCQSIQDGQRNAKKKKEEGEDAEPKAKKDKADKDKTSKNKDKNGTEKDGKTELQPENQNAEPSGDAPKTEPEKQQPSSGSDNDSPQPSSGEAHADNPEHNGSSGDKGLTPAM